MMLFALLCSGAVSATALFVLSHPRIAKGWLDRPNDRSLHVVPVARTGGVAIMLSVAVSSLVFLHAVSPVVWICVGLAILSLIDDRLGLHPTIRFSAHFAAACLLVGFARPGEQALSWVAIVFATTWMTNLYNFMDGSDGLAGGMAVIGFGSYALLASLNGDITVATMAACISAASLAFLFFNYHPAKIFMGDVGSIPLGFLAAALGILGWKNGTWAFWFPVAVFSPFIFDASVTLVRRLLRGEKVWQAHREHYYQRLVLMGYGHLKTFYFEVALMLLSAIIAITASRTPPALAAALLTGLAVVYVMAALWVDFQWSKFKRNTPQNS